jgi:hypothetical protein
MIEYQDCGMIVMIIREKFLLATMTEYGAYRIHESAGCV